MLNESPNFLIETIPRSFLFLDPAFKGSNDVGNDKDDDNDNYDDSGNDNDLLTTATTSTTMTIAPMTTTT